MGMIFAAEYMQLLIHATAQRTLRQHAFDGELNRTLRVLLQKLAQGDALQVPDVAGMLVVELVGKFGARDAYLAGVDHDDMIAKVLMRRIIRLVLAFQTMPDFRGQAVSIFACGVS